MINTLDCKNTKILLSGKKKINKMVFYKKKRRHEVRLYSKL